MADEHLTSLLELLADQIDDLKESLSPLTSGPLNDSSRNLPVLDKAKLCVLVSYSIESLLFSSLRLSSVPTKTHPIMTELQRVRQYVSKLKEAEQKNPPPASTTSASAPAVSIPTGPSSTTKSTPSTQTLRLDKEAAGRILKQAMISYDIEDERRVKQVLKEREGARKKLEAMGPGERDELGRREQSIEGDGPDLRIVDGEGDEEMEEEEVEAEVVEVKNEKAKRKEEKRKRREEEDPADRKRRRAERREKKEKKEKEKKKEGKEKITS